MLVDKRNMLDLQCNRSLRNHWHCQIPRTTSGKHRLHNRTHQYLPIGAPHLAQCQGIPRLVRVPKLVPPGHFYTRNMLDLQCNPSLRTHCHHQIARTTSGKHRPRSRNHPNLPIGMSQLAQCQGIPAGWLFSPRSVLKSVWASPGGSQNNRNMPGLQYNPGSRT